MHEIDDIGPIRINWDYEKDIAPFLDKSVYPVKATSYEKNFIAF